MSIEALEKQVIKWAWDRRIFPESTEYTRFGKFCEEVEGLADAMFPDNGQAQDMSQVKLEAGDVLVTLINILHPYGMDLETCLAAAYKKISNRTGKMVNGMFVQDRCPACAGSEKHGDDVCVDCAGSGEWDGGEE